MSSSKSVKENSDFKPTPILAGELDQKSDWSSGAAFARKETAAPLTPNGRPGKHASASAGAAPFGIDEIKEEAFKKGRLTGMKEAEEQFGAVTQALAAALEDIAQLRSEILTNSTEDMLKLVLAIAEQVIRSEITVRKDVILTTLNEALQAAIRSDEFHVRVNPDDLAMATEKKSQFLSRIAGLKNINFEADPKISPGGCIVESQFGRVEATIESQFAEIRRHLENSLEKG
ncbi:MAG: hypothetical protein A2521_11280 [Deltaproteobacteria bacterium RIFOXYD12_FULL_57_12]|nr:MAG: hypothetical protein A2521_11280 [Deltaproteobacteria bacterium RIFOXYD12_FULL_57_12]